jgi:hypothetical protein
MSFYLNGFKSLFLTQNKENQDSILKKMVLELSGAFLHIHL